MVNIVWNKESSEIKKDIKSDIVWNEPTIKENKTNIVWSNIKEPIKQSFEKVSNIPKTIFGMPIDISKKLIQPKQSKQQLKQDISNNIQGLVNKYPEENKEYIKPKFDLGKTIQTAINPLGIKSDVKDKNILNVATEPLNVAKDTLYETTKYAEKNPRIFTLAFAGASGLGVVSPAVVGLFELSQQAKNAIVSYAKKEKYNPLEMRMITEILPDTVSGELKTLLGLGENIAEVIAMGRIVNLANKGLLNKSLNEFVSKVKKAGYDTTKIEQIPKEVISQAVKGTTLDNEIQRYIKVKNLEVPQKVKPFEEISTTKQIEQPLETIQPKPAITPQIQPKIGIPATIAPQTNIIPQEPIKTSNIQPSIQPKSMTVQAYDLGQQIKNNPQEIQKVEQELNSVREQLKTQPDNADLVFKGQKLRETLESTKDIMIKDETGRIKYAPSEIGKQIEQEYVDTIYNESGFVQEIPKQMQNVKMPPVKSEISIHKHMFKLGLEEGKQIITEKLNQKIDDIKQIKQTIYDYSKLYLPISERGRILTDIKNAKTQTGLENAYNKVIKVQEEFKRKSYLKAINKQFKGMVDSPTVEFSSKEQAKQLIKDSSFMLYGKEMGLKEFNSGKLRNIYNQLRMIEEQGRQKFNTKQEKYEFEKNYKINELLKDLTPIEEKQIIKQPLRKLDNTEAISNAVNKVINKYNYLTRNLTPMNIFFDMIGGATGKFDTAPIRIFKYPLDDDWHNSRQAINKVEKELFEICDKVKLTELEENRIGIYAASKSPLGIETLLDNGISQKEIDSIKLTDREQKVYDYISNFYKNIYPELNKFLIENENRSLGYFDVYTPFFLDYDKLSELDLWERFSQPKRLTKQTEKGFTKTRVGGAKIEFNAIKNFKHYIENSYSLLYRSKNIKMLFEIANSPVFREKVGDIAATEIVKWLDMNAKNGAVSGKQKIKILDISSKNTGIFILGFRAITPLLQLTTIFDSQMYIGQYAYDGFFNYIFRPELRKFLYDNFPEIRERVGDEYTAFMEMSGNTLYDKLQRLSMEGIKAGDELMMGSSLIGAYFKKLNDLNIKFDINNINKEAFDYARLVTQNSQVSTFTKDLPPFLSGAEGNKSFNRAIAKFLTFVSGRFYNAKYFIWDAGIKRNDYKKAAVGLLCVMLWVAAETGLRRGQELVFKKLGIGKNEEEEKEYNFIKEFLINAAQSVPFVGTAVSVAMYRSSNPLPIFKAPVQTLGGLAKLFSPIDKMSTYKQIEQKQKQRVKGGIEAVSGIGGLFGLPTDQLTKILLNHIDNKNKR